jgi:alpha-1,2-mannosyltransferase
MEVRRPGPDRSAARDGGGLRAAIAIGVAAIALIAGFTIAAGVTGSFVAAVPVALAISGAAGVYVWKRPIVAYDSGAISRPLQIVSAVAAVTALGQFARLAVFMVAPHLPAYSMFPSSQWERRHSCLTAYFVAGEAIPTVANLYDDALHALPGDPTKQRVPKTLGPFRIDAYEYPPPFLLLPRALGLIAPDFLRLRMVWFGLTAGVLLAAMMAVARLLGPAAGTRAILLAPLVWAGIPMLNSLQKGNVQVLIIAISMLALVLFARGREVAGGALLGYACVGKIYPGMLVLYLILRRQWRAVAWTSGFALVLLVLSLADTGAAPILAFVEHLPGILGGEAFPAFRNPTAVAVNVSVPGLVFKAKLFGVAGMSFATSKLLGWIYTVVVVAAIVLAARRTMRDEEAPPVWLAILILATLRSPFLPQGYGVFTAIWLATLVAALRPPTAKTILLVVAAWTCFNLYVPQDWGVPARGIALITTIPQVAMVVVTILALRGRAAAEEVDAAPIERGAAPAAAPA